MNKLYWIVCEEADRTLYEGRYLGRTRGGAIKHLKEKLGRASLSGLVFSITEIPLPLIRQIVREILAGTGLRIEEGRLPIEETAPVETAPEQPKAGPERFNAFASEPEQSSILNRPSSISPDWTAIKACYMEGRGPKDVAEIMKVPLNTLRGRITREGWAKERRQS